MLRNLIYYRLKPFIPQSLRTAVRRRIASRVRRTVGDIWPIIPGSERPPNGWPGWPEGKKFALVLTHDVESVAGLARCQELMTLEMKLGFRSSFNFVPEGEYRVSRELREELTQNGFEVGIHDLRHDGRLYQSERGFKRNASRINQYLTDWGSVGFRSAFMFHKLKWLHELNIQYDASTFDTDPFEPQPEGRHTIFPFWVPAPAAPQGQMQRTDDGDQKSEVGSRISNLSSDVRHSTFDIRHSAGRAGGYVELPYTLPQDSTLFLLLREETPEIWLRKVDWIAEHGGMALIITHPDYMSFSGNSSIQTGEYPAELYGRLLEYVRSKYSAKYWQPLPREMAQFVVQQKNETGSASQSRVELGFAGAHLSTTNLTLNGTPILRPIDRLRGKRAAVLLFSYYPADPRPHRATEALAREGVLVDLICLQRNRDEPRREIINGVKVLRLSLNRRRGGKLKYVRQYSVFILRSFLHLTFRSLFRKYDLVHVHNMPDALVFSALVPKILGARIILDLHDPMPELMQTIFGLPESSLTVRLLKGLEKWSIGFADLVLTVNLACKKIYSSRSCPPEKVHVVLNSPEDAIFGFQAATFQSSNDSKSTEPFVILYHGSLVPRNGFDLAVAALQQARKSIPKARLIVCGERTAFFDEVMESARQRGVQENIEYLGMKNHQGIVDAINSCDLGIIPNHRNTFTEINTPTRIFEYLARGRPVIAPGTQGIRDYFGDDDLIFFQAGDPVDLAHKIEFAFNNPVKVGEIVERGQKVYLDHRWSRQKSDLLDSIGALF